MKRVPMWMVIVVLMVGGVALADEDKPVRSIAVSGTVETRTAPDRIVWNITLTDTDKDMRKAKAGNDEKVKAVVALRKKLGVGEGDFETGRLNIRREYERDERGHRGDFKHFVVTRSVTIRQRDLKRFDEFLDTLVASAEMEVNFSFESSRMHEIRADTRLRALRQAKDKAATMAEVVGAKLGPVLTINEHRLGGGWNNPLSNAAFVRSEPDPDLASDTFVPGAITVRVTVYATFELQ